MEIGQRDRRDGVAARREGRAALVVERGTHQGEPPSTDVRSAAEGRRALLVPGRRGRFDRVQRIGGVDGSVRPLHGLGRIAGLCARSGGLAEHETPLGVLGQADHQLERRAGQRIGHQAGPGVHVERRGGGRAAHDATRRRDHRRRRVCRETGGRAQRRGRGRGPAHRGGLGGGRGGRATGNLGRRGRRVRSGPAHRRHDTEDRDRERHDRLGRWRVARGPPDWSARIAAPARRTRTDGWERRRDQGRRSGRGPDVLRPPRPPCRCCRR